ncbi:hypothetical protein DL766_002358 [Monosporascus sp. MC13-8B]|uniref:Uncharacterized protein n=1 Tax=Monosporascus cannonballus TaxID=155416 RepID=A0ABY0HFV7_9PEZI|nr:hypothetical protein DL762_001595 [Monosporascus cannonballus]RYP00288.1 hypothetical protein DL763_000899 [Monosporascus cannonballus]RYP35705.1 hypothetical protein DL766_002358 [Monosporascus sp. MC13-8B]
MRGAIKSRLRNAFGSADEVLHACIRDNDIPQLQQLLRASPAPDINYSHPEFGPPLHFAAWCGNLDAVNLLLAAGADAFIVSYGEQRLTAIGFAAFKGHRDIVKRLWTCCRPESHVEGLKPYQTCFVVAATHGHASIVEDMLDWWNGWSQELRIEALLWASRRWHFGVVTLLLKRTSFEQPTLQEALHAATNHKFMLSYEFDIKYEGIDYLDQQLLIASLIDAGADPNSCPDNAPLIYTTAHNANLTGALKTLLEKGADPNKTDGSGKSALHVLASPVMIGQLAGGPGLLNETAIHLLLQHKASVSQPDTAVRGTEIKTLAQAVRAAYHILSHGADPSITTNEGWTPLHVLALHCDLDVTGKAAELAKHLISRGADPEARAPLLSPGNRQVVPSLGMPWGYRLRDAMADPSAQRMVIRHDLTPLHWAAERGAVGVIRALLANGVNVSSMDVDGISPARMAAESKFLERRTDLVDTIIDLLTLGQRR